MSPADIFAWAFLLNELADLIERRLQTGRKITPEEVQAAWEAAQKATAEWQAGLPKKE